MTSLHHFLRAANVAGGSIEFVGSTTATYVGAATDVSLSLTSLTGGIGSQPAAGDFILVFLAGWGANNTGWNIKDGSGTAYAYEATSSYYSSTYFMYHVQYAGWKFAGGTPDTNLTFSGPSINTEKCVVVMVFRGVDSVTPFDVATVVNGTGTVGSSLPNPSSITPSTSGAFVVAAGSVAGSSASGTMTSSDLDYFAQRTSPAAGAYKAAIGVGYEAWSGGAFDPAAFGGVTASNATNIAQTMALRPA